MDAVGEELCPGCLSRGRRLQRLADDAREYFNDILSSVRGARAAAALCWECAGAVRAALRLRGRARCAARALRQHQLTHLSELPSLSRLARHTPASAEHVTSRALAAEHVTSRAHSAEHVTSRALEFVKQETPRPGEYLDEGGGGDGGGVKAEIDHHAGQDVGGGKEEFSWSDDEPLAAHSARKREGGDKKKKKKKKKKEGGAARALAALGVPAGALQRVELSRAELERERSARRLAPAFLRCALRCERCVLPFSRRAALARHLDKHRPSSGPAECGVCGVRCPHTHALRAHERRHRLRWRCTVCGALWSRAAVAADHLSREHDVTPPTHACRLCAHVAPSLGKLRRHAAGAHGAAAQCPLCHKTLRDAASLRTHLFIHRGEKEWACAECGKMFLFKKAMELHRDTHTARALYCHQCDVTFRSRQSFYQHMRYSLRHVSPDRLKHACGECGARFVRAARLREHRLARHERRRPLPCERDGCTYTSASRAVLRAHTRSAHAPPPPPRAAPPTPRHVCHACGKTYTTKKSLEDHLRAHSGERPYRCGQCGAAFSYRAALYNHTRLAHRLRAANGKGGAPADATEATPTPLAADTGPEDIT